MSSPKTTVYVTCHNYGRYLNECLESIEQQTCRDWELLIFDDGSTDDSLDIARAFAHRHGERVRVVAHAEAQGLRACANEALQMARGRYIIRVDADDYLDENALLVLSNYLDTRPEMALVFPNWTYISEDGEILGVEKRRKVDAATNVLDMPPHGAVTMVRKRILKAVGGYDTSYTAQDGHELWLKIVQRYPVGNVSTPLFFYRQHPVSMSRDEDRLLSARRHIKRGQIEKLSGPVAPRVAAIVPAKNTYEDFPNVVLEPLAGKPLIDYTLEAALASQVIDDLLVFTDDPAVAAHSETFAPAIAQVRPSGLSGLQTTLAEVVQAALEHLEQERGLSPDIVVLLSVHAPLRRAEHIREAVDTLILYNVDHVISTYEDVELHFTHTADGMRPLNPGMLQRLRYEREALFVDNGAVHAAWRDSLDGRLYEGKIGHTVMPRHDSYQIKSKADLELIALLLRERQRRESAASEAAPLRAK